jgi:hypothetical protein
MNFMRISLVVLALLVCACGGGGSGSTPPVGDPPVTAAPGGLYVGYYQEDATNNPEDPVPGALYLSLPEDDSAFSGSMSFTYVGCQTANVGTISGTKAKLDLNGSWTGTVDGLAQKGKYVGKFDPSLKLYQGTYTNDGGKQYRDLSPCIQYYIAANGIWELFPQEQTYSTDATATGVIINGNQINWYPPAGTQASFVSVIDALIASSGGAAAIVWQNIYNGSTASATVPPGKLQSGRSYIVTAGSQADGKRTYFSSKKFTAP